MIKASIDLTREKQEQEISITGPAVNLAAETKFIINRIYNRCCGCKASMADEYKRELLKLLLDREQTPFRRD